MTSTGAPPPLIPVPSYAIEYHGLAPRPSRWPAMLFSSALHAFAVLLVPPLLTAVAADPQTENWRSALHLDRTLRVRLPEPLYAPQIAPPPRPVYRVSAEAARDLRNPGRIGSGGGPGGARLPSLDDLDTAIEFAGPKSSIGKTLVRPEAPNRAVPDLRAPSVIMWAQELPSDPGRVLRPGSGLAIPALRPARSFLAPPARDPQLGAQPGDPIQVLSFAPKSGLAGASFEVPFATQVGNLPGPPGPAPVAAAEGAAPSPLLERVLAQLLAATRVAHPENGRFDIVVESSGGNLLPDGVTLSGRPIHAVFLKVGAPKDWILQYCVPSADAPPAAGTTGVVRLGAPAAVQAPYPRLTFRPPARRRSYLLVHGFIEASGQFSGLGLTDASDPDEAWLVLTILNRWQFRPASIGGRPVRVEILLAIAPEA